MQCKPPSRCLWITLHPVGQKLCLVSYCLHHLPGMLLSGAAGLPACSAAAGSGCWSSSLWSASPRGKLWLLPARPLHQHRNTEHFTDMRLLHSTDIIQLIRIGSKHKIGWGKQLLFVSLWQINVWNFIFLWDMETSVFTQWIMRNAFKDDAICGKKERPLCW